MRPQIVTILIMALSVITYAPMFGQATSAGSSPPAPRPPGPPELPLPLDDNLYVLLILAVLYGSFVAYKKVIAKKKAS